MSEIKRLREQGMLGKTGPQLNERTKETTKRLIINGKPAKQVSKMSKIKIKLFILIVTGIG